MVTGGAGFIGSNLVDRLIEEKHDVVIVDDLSTGKEGYLNSQAKFYKADVCSADLDSVFKKEAPEFAFHLAAQIDVRKSIEDPVADSRINVGGSLNVFKNCAENKIKKVIFFSTAGVYGDLKAPAREDNPIFFDAPYGVHKYTSEKNLEVLGQIHGLDYVIFRPANIYGPRQYKGGEGAVVGVFTSNAVSGEESVLYGDGTQTRDFIYVGDVVEACLKTINNNVQDVFNISTGRETSILDLMEAIEKATGEKFKFREEPKRKGEIERSVLSSLKAKDLLGWGSKVSLEDGIAMTMEWAKQQLTKEQ